MTELVRQRAPFDCGVCCFVMIIGRPYEEVIDGLGDLYDPTCGISQVSKSLQRLGFEWAPDGDFRSLCRLPDRTPEQFREIAWGRRALMTVPSLNNEGCWHFVFYDGRAVFDPSNKKTYRSFDELRPEDIVIFRERP